MAEKIVSTGKGKSKKGFRGTLTEHEKALLVELITIYGLRGAAQRFAR